MHLQGNYSSLLPSEYVSLHMDLEADENIIYCSQGGELWHKLRKKSRLTGSSMHHALGLDTLKVEKEHVNVHVKGCPKPDVTPEVQKYLDFGSKNEINAMATLMSVIMPALLPSCYTLYEVGMQFIHGRNLRNLIEVSADGLIKCRNGSNCTNVNIGVRQAHKTIVAEAKCIFPSDDFPKFPHYKLPIWHVPQCLCEIVAYNADELWLISFTIYSVTLIIVYFDQELWKKLLELAEDKYGVDIPKLPTKLHPQSKILHKELEKFVETHTKFVLEVPSFRGNLEINLPEHFTSPYSSAIHV